MLSINNKALPTPGELEIGLIAVPDAPYLSLIRLRAAWPGLSLSGMKEVLKDTAQSFTLACPDPRAGAERGFTAKLTACEAKAMGGGMYRLEAGMEEVM